ncbi:MAG: DUF2085 domain-containing protein [Balneolaceae bacterium]|nr:DUF2085 domain-containing protein [Balneolaceae bacterium]
MPIGRHHYGLYTYVAGAVTFVAVAALGGGLWGQQTHWMLQWQHTMFELLCHQIPDRSFWLGGQPMAVCSRCMGVYGGMLAGVLIVPMAGSVFPTVRRRLRFDFLKWAVAGTAALNGADILGNMLSFWQNTLHSRLALGLLVGVAVSALIISAMTTHNEKKEILHYGTA